MRRIYESSALSRDESDPFSPGRDPDADRPQAIPWIDSTAWSRRLLPSWLCYRGISVEVTSPQTAYEVGETVPFAVTMKNTLPFPIVLSTESPVLWNWDVDGVVEASQVPLQDPPDEQGTITFDRGERKQVRRHWQQMFRVSESEWKPAEPGEYTIGAGLNVDRAAERGVYDETTIQLHEPE